MHPLIQSLERLSEAACEALPLLEKYDYRKEAEDYLAAKLELKVIPKQLQEILNSLIMYCTPITYNEERVPDAALLNADNMRCFAENLNISGDWSCIRQLNHIDLEPIKDVKNILEQMGVSKHARLLDNVCNFAESLRSHSRSHLIRPASIYNTSVSINVTLSPEDLTDAEHQAAQAFKEFNKIFRAGVLNSAQRRALYDAFVNLIKDDTGSKPHLTITAAILLLMKSRVYGKPLIGKFHTIRKTIFTSLGLPETTAKNYKESSLTKSETPTLYNYKEQAALILSTALGTTR